MPEPSITQPNEPAPMATIKSPEIADNSGAVAGEGVEVAVIIKLIRSDELAMALGTIGRRFSEITLQFVHGLQLVEPKFPEKPVAQ